MAPIEGGESHTQGRRSRPGEGEATPRGGGHAQGPRGRGKPHPGGEEEEEVTREGEATPMGGI